MKNIYITTILSIMALGLLATGMIHQPASAQRPNYDRPPMFITCYHEVNGVRDPVPYATGPYELGCPAWGSSPSAAVREAELKAIEKMIGLPPHLCKEVGLPDY